MVNHPTRAVSRGLPYLKIEEVTDDDSIGLEGYREPKVPTLILYDENDPSKFKWGGQVTWRDPAVHGVKLLLDPAQKKPEYLPATSFETDRNALPKDPVDVAADFIGAMYNHALSVAGSSVIRDFFDMCEKEFILSVPAVWSDKAKDLTLKVELRGWHVFVSLTTALTCIENRPRRKPAFIQSR